MSISVAGFVAAYPEFENYDSDVLAHAIARANLGTLSAYDSGTDEDARRYLEAAAILFDRPRGRSLLADHPYAEKNPYREEANRLDRRKGSVRRVPGSSWPWVS